MTGIVRVYIHTPDRLARKYAHQALLLEEFSKHHCKVICIDHEGLADNPETNLLVQMQGERIENDNGNDL